MTRIGSVFAFDALVLSSSIGGAGTLDGTEINDQGGI